MFDAIHPTLPVSDLDRAKQWYADRLGLSPVDEDPQGAWYEVGNTRFLLYPSAFAGTNQATAASFTTDDLAAAIAQMRAAGVVFEEFEFEDLETVDGVLTDPDGNQAAWFKDSEGNIIAISTM